jgi:hypothetical protein
MLVRVHPGQSVELADAEILRAAFRLGYTDDGGSEAALIMGAVLIIERRTNWTAGHESNRQTQERKCIHK